MGTETWATLKDEVGKVAKGQEVRPDTSIANDLGLDSLAIMNFIMLLEDRFDLSIPMDVIADTETMGDLATVIDTLVAEQYPA